MQGVSTQDVALAGLCLRVSAVRKRGDDVFGQGRDRQKRIHFESRPND
jgi:hypothetical protein